MGTSRHVQVDSVVVLAARTVGDRVLVLAEAGVRALVLMAADQQLGVPDRIRVLLLPVLRAQASVPPRVTLAGARINKAF